MSMNKFDEMIYKMLEEESIPGGISSGYSILDVANKWGITEEEVEKLIKDGSKIEKEHTNDKARAKEIAKDHIWEMGPKYYKELKKMENNLKKSSKPEDDTIDECMVSGGVMSAFGPGVTSTASQFSGDTYASGDARIPKVLGKMQRRTFPETTILGNKSKKKRVNKK